MNSPNSFPFLFAGFILFFVVIAIASYRAKQKRIAELTALAQRLGFAYYPEGPMSSPTTGVMESLAMAFRPSADDVFLQRFAGFEPFGRGFGHDVGNLIVGRRGELDWYLFDYTYKTESTDSEGKRSTQTHFFGVVACQVPFVLPNLTLTQENFLHRIGQKFGLQEMNFELEEFNRRYFIRSADPKRAYDLLHPQAIDYLMHQPVRHWQFGMLDILIVRSGYFPSLEIDRVMQEIEGFVRLVPAYYRQDNGANRLHS